MSCLAAVGCLAVGFTLVPRWEPSRPTRMTKFVGPRGEQLAALFDGLSPHPRFDAVLAQLVNKPGARRCRDSVVARWIGTLETTVYAQSDPCNDGDCSQCSGYNWADANPEPNCPSSAGCGGGTYNSDTWSPLNPSGRGTTKLCSSQCGVGCGTPCPYQTCDNGYVPPPSGCVTRSCTGDLDCADLGATCDTLTGCCDLPDPPSLCIFGTASCSGSDSSSCSGGSAGVPPCSNGCCSPAPPSGSGGEDSDCNPGECDFPLRCVEHHCQDFNDDDPILFDLGGGIQLTSARNGVNFQFFNNTRPAMTPWTVAGVHEAWLVFDLNRNGRIDGGWELFGNAMSQDGPASGWTGFFALAQFDKPAHGGNGDGVIDRNDRVFPYLLLWSDLNHNGISEPNELTSLGAAGVIRIDLKTVPAHYTDAYGNQIRNRAHIATEERGYGKDHWVYDVILAKTS